MKKIFWYNVGENNDELSAQSSTTMNAMTLEGFEISKIVRDVFIKISFHNFVISSLKTIFPYLFFNENKNNKTCKDVIPFVNTSSKVIPSLKRSLKRSFATSTGLSANKKKRNNF